VLHGSPHLFFFGYEWAESALHLPSEAATFRDIEPDEINEILKFPYPLEHAPSECRAIPQCIAGSTKRSHAERNKSAFPSPRCLSAIPHRLCWRHRRPNASRRSFTHAGNALPARVIHGLLIDLDVQK